MNQTFAGLNQRALLISALVAGVAIGLLSHIPVVACLNCLLFAWVWGGAIFAVYLYRNNTNRLPLNTGQGAIIGALAGVVGAIVGAVVAAIFGGMSAAFNQVLNDLAGQTGQNIPSFLFSAGFSALRTVGDIFLYGIIGAIGGLIATGLIWKSPVTYPPYTPPPPPPPPAPMP